MISNCEFNYEDVSVNLIDVKQLVRDSKKVNEFIDSYLEELKNKKKEMLDEMFEAMYHEYFIDHTIDDLIALHKQKHIKHYTKEAKTKYNNLGFIEKIFTSEEQYVQYVQSIVDEKLESYSNTDNVYGFPRNCIRHYNNKDSKDNLKKEFINEIYNIRNSSTEYYNGYHEVHYYSYVNYFEGHIKKTILPFLEEYNQVEEELENTTKFRKVVKTILEMHSIEQDFNVCFKDYISIKHRLKELREKHS